MWDSIYRCFTKPYYGGTMSISSDVTITRQKALEAVMFQLSVNHINLIRKAVNSMTNDELAMELHNDMNFFHVEGEGILKEEWEE